VVKTANAQQLLPGLRIWFKDKGQTPPKPCKGIIQP